jgi:hypothetical protein
LLPNAALGTVQKSDQKIKKNANDADKGQVVSQNWPLVWIFGSLVTPQPDFLKSDASSSKAVIKTKRAAE